MARALLAAGVHPDGGVAGGLEGAAQSASDDAEQGHSPKGRRRRRPLPPAEGASTGPNSLVFLVFKFGWLTPLAMATARRDDPLVDLLVAAGADGSRYRVTVQLHTTNPNHGPGASENKESLVAFD